VKPHVVCTKSARRPGVRPDQLDRQIIVDPFRAMEGRRRQARNNALPMRVQPCRPRPLGQRQHRISAYVDIGKHRAAAGSKFMLSNCPAGYGLTADERFVEHLHESILARHLPSKLLTDRNLWMNRDL
jgi:hypothetical protein